MSGLPAVDDCKSDPANRGAVCQIGLWRCSRDPNYFFERLAWVAYFVVALGSPWGWLTLYCPALMLHFLLRVTGIALTEQLSLQSQGAAARDGARSCCAGLRTRLAYGGVNQPTPAGTR